MRFKPLLLVRCILTGLLLLAVSCAPTPSTPVDTSAANLDVNINIPEGLAAGYNTLPVIVQFLSSGHIVQFGTGEIITCNGIALSFNALVNGYTERVPIQPVGGTYAFIYTRNGVPTTVTVTAPPRPKFLDPTMGSKITRSANLTINYTTTGTGFSMSASASDGQTAVSGKLLNQADSGAYTMDVTSLKLEPGSISLTREFHSAPANTGFRSVAVVYGSNSEIKVTWQ
jgi:hypothetical protein